MPEDPESKIEALHKRLLAEVDGFDRLLVHPVRFNTALRAVLESIGRKLAEGSHYTTVESCDEDDVIYAQELLGVIASALGVET